MRYISRKCESARWLAGQNAARVTGPVSALSTRRLARWHSRKPTSGRPSTCARAASLSRSPWDTQAAKDHGENSGSGSYAESDNVYLPGTHTDRRERWDPDPKRQFHDDPMTENSLR